MITLKGEGMTVAQASSTPELIGPSTSWLAGKGTTNKVRMKGAHADMQLAPISMHTRTVACWGLRLCSGGARQ